MATNAVSTVDGTELVTVGRVARAHGRRGEIAVDALTGDPARFRELDRLLVRRPDGAVEGFELEGVRLHKGRPVLKLAGVDSIGDAERLAGRELAVPQSEVEPLAKDEYYHFQLVGLAVEDVSGEHLGKVASVLSTGGTDVLVVRGEGGEILVPLCREHCPEIDPEAGRLVVSLPEGLRDLHAR